MPAHRRPPTASAAGRRPPLAPALLWPLTHALCTPPRPAAARTLAGALGLEPFTLRKWDGSVAGPYVYLNSTTKLLVGTRPAGDDSFFGLRLRRTPRNFTGVPVGQGTWYALANAQDLGDWLGVGPAGLFNFRPSVRPVPLEAHIQGYPGRFYCPRMAAMNKPACVFFWGPARFAAAASLSVRLSLSLSLSCRCRPSAGRSPTPSPLPSPSPSSSS